MLRTTRDLNRTTWYRLAKVVYVSMFLLLLSAGLWAVLESNPPKNVVNPKLTKVQCAVGDHKQFTAAELGLSLTPEDFDYLKEFTFERNNDRHRLQEACGYSKLDLIFGLTETGPFDRGLRIFSWDETVARDLRLHGLTDEQIGALDKSVEYQYTGSPVARVIPYYDQPRDWLRILTVSFIVVVALALIFEVTRRIVYYILLGSLRPKPD